MIINNDTLPYTLAIEARHGDTTYLGTCRTFEKINGQIVNQTDEQCLQQGHWIFWDCLGNYWTGDFKDGKALGLWKYFSDDGKLLKERETVTIDNDTYTVKEIDYSSGQAITIINKPFLAFYLNNLISIVIILIIASFCRIFINSSIYNSENGTNYSPIYFHFGPIVTRNFGHSLFCTFSFWFTNYKPENRRLVFITNTLSVITLALFFGAIIGLAIEGDI